MSKVLIVCHVPHEYADAVRQAMGDAGSGVEGNYHHCSFTMEGTGRFTGNDQSNPAIGTAGVAEQVSEVHIETTCDRSIAKQVVAAIAAAQPYEQPAIYVHELLDISEL